MKSKILMCLVLASCSTVFAKEDKAKDVYTDMVKSTEVEDDILIKKDDVYVCDYRYKNSARKKKYFKFCDKDGKPLNNTIEFENRKYELRDGYIYYQELKPNNWTVFQQINNPEYSDTELPYIEEERIYKNGKLATDRYDDLLMNVERNFCSDGRMISENIKDSYYSLSIYNEVKKDGVKLNGPLIVESIDKSKLDEKTGVKIDKKNVHFVNGNRVTDGFFEIADCYGVTSYNLKNGKYEGDVVYDTSVISKIKKYENGELKSEIHIFKDDKPMLAGVGYYNKYEVIMDKDDYTFRYYLDDKLIKEY